MLGPPSPSRPHRGAGVSPAGWPGVSPGGLVLAARRRRNPQPGRLRYEVGFVSNADAKTVYYLDNPSLANDTKP